MGRTLRHQEDAASSAIAFIVAGVLFVTAVTLVIYVTNDKVAADPQRSDISGNGVSADSLLGLFLSPGSGWDGTGWDAGATTFRPSLVDESGILDYERLDSFRSLTTQQIREAYQLDDATGDQVPLGFYLEVTSDEPSFFAAFGTTTLTVGTDPLYGAGTGAAVQTASLSARIDPDEVPYGTALVTLHVYASTS